MRSRSCLGGARAFANQLLQRARVQVAETLEAHAALADLRLGQRLFVLLGYVSVLAGPADIERDVILVAGHADAEPVAFASALGLVVVRTVSQHADMDERLQFRGHFSDQRVEGGNLCLARLLELRQVFRRGGNSELAFHDFIDYHARPRPQNPPTAPPAVSSYRRFRRSPRSARGTRRGSKCCPDKSRRPPGAWGRSGSSLACGHMCRCITVCRCGTLAPSCRRAYVPGEPEDAPGSDLRRHRRRDTQSKRRLGRDKHRAENRWGWLWS